MEEQPRCPVAEGSVASSRVREGQLVDLIIEGDMLLIRAGRPHYTLEELVAAMRPEEQPGTFDDVRTPPVGNEAL